MIDESQSTFLGGQNMMDGVVITNEVIQEAKEKKKPCFILKVSKKLMIM